MARTERAEKELYFDAKLEPNDVATSIGEDMKESDIDFELPLDGFNVKRVPDDVILLEDLPIKEEMTDDGMIIKDGLVFTKDQYRDNLGGNMFKACKVVMVGKNVDETNKGDVVVIEEKAGIPITFAGSKYIFARERQIFMFVEEQD